MRKSVLVGLLLALVVAVVVSQFASASPDGLMYVADKEGFLDTTKDHPLADTALGNYGDGLTGNSNLDTAIAGAVGVAVTALLGWGLFRLVRRRSAPSAS